MAAYSGYQSTIFSRCLKLQQAILKRVPGVGMVGLITAAVHAPCGRFDYGVFAEVVQLLRSWRS
jgi:hypothetical protein